MQGSLLVKVSSISIPLVQQMNEYDLVYENPLK